MDAAAPDGYGERVRGRHRTGGGRARLAYADNLKMALVAVVIVAHVTTVWTDLPGAWVLDEPPVRQPLLSLLRLASVVAVLFGMTLFFLVAGMFTPGSLQRKGLRRFAVDRTVRLLIPILLFVLLFTPPIEFVDTSNAGWVGGFWAPRSARRWSRLSRPSAMWRCSTAAAGWQSLVFAVLEGVVMVTMSLWLVDLFRESPGTFGPSADRCGMAMLPGTCSLLVGEAVMPEVSGLGLAEAIESIRAELLAARASGEKEDIRLPVQTVTVALQVVAATGLEGKAGFRVPVVNLELGGSGSRRREDTSTVTIVFGPPVNRAGIPVKVTSTSGQPKG